MCGRFGCNKRFGVTHHILSIPSGIWRADRALGTCIDSGLYEPDLPGAFSRWSCRLMPWCSPIIYHCDSLWVPGGQSNDFADP